MRPFGFTSKLRPQNAVQQQICFRGNNAGKGPNLFENSQKTEIVKKLYQKIQKNQGFLSVNIFLTDLWNSIFTFFRYIRKLTPYFEFFWQFLRIIAMFVLRQKTRSFWGETIPKFWKPENSSEETPFWFW